MSSRLLLVVGSFGVPLVVLLLAFWWDARKRLGRTAGDAHSMRWLPLLLAPLVLVALGVVVLDRFGIEAGQRFTGILSLFVFLGTGAVGWRFVRREHRLGRVLVKLPSVVPPAAHYAFAVFALLPVGLDLYLWWAFERGPSALTAMMLALAAQNLMLARARQEFREGGICAGLLDYRWDRVRGWRWQAGTAGPVLMLQLGRWPQAAWPIPEDRRASIDSALAQYAGAKP